MKCGYEDIAKTAHEANRALCRAFGDDSQVPWEEAPDWQRTSALDGVKKTHDGTVTSPQQSHENWLTMKRADGWVYGAVKDPEAKTHPCMVPYDDLPPEQRAKDHVFQAVVRTMLALEEEG